MGAVLIETEGGIADVRISLFDGVGVTTDEGVPVDVGPAKCQAVLAVLALSPGSVVPVTRIIELVWGDDPPRTADKTLQSYVTRLRKGLGNEAIVRVGAAYRLDVRRESVDIARFQRLLDSGDTEAALAEWTGTPLAGLDAAPLTAAVDGLVEQYLGAVEADLSRRQETDAASTIGALTELTATYPFREGLWALLMTALYRVGRQADALAAYRRARQHLVDDLGVEPGPRLRELEAMVLGQDEQLGVDRSAHGSPLGQPTGTVTFGFCDVENSTRLWFSHRREMATAMARHDELVQAAVSADRRVRVRHRGRLVRGRVPPDRRRGHLGERRAGGNARRAVAARRRDPGAHRVAHRRDRGARQRLLRARGGGGSPDLRRPVTAVRLLVSSVTAMLLDGVGLRDLGTYRLDGVVAEQRILQLGDGDHPPLRTDEGRRGNLPRRLGRLFGRESELIAVHDAMAASPVVTLVGPGGIGKTRLAVAAARRAGVDVESGAWLVELATVNTSADVARAVAEVLDVRESPGQTWMESIVASLGSRRALVVLDNCEHVVDRCGGGRAGARRGMPQRARADDLAGGSRVA